MSDDEARALEIQRRAFEAQFGSLEDLGYDDKTRDVPAQSSSEEDDEEEEEFGGFARNGYEEQEDEEDEEGLIENYSKSDSSESEASSSSESEEDAPKVVRISDNFTPRNQKVSKIDKRLLKSGRAPTLGEIESKRKAALQQAEKELRRQGTTPDDAENLKNDLELQRLLSESHILAHNMDYSGAELTLSTMDHDQPTGKARKRILDQRIREVAATNSRTGGLPAKLEKMPMGMRRGMINAHNDRVAKHEQEARDAGIVLSKVRKGHTRQLNTGKGVTARSDRLGVGIKKKDAKRDRGLRIHAVGKSTRNGLVISDRDITRLGGTGEKKGKKRGRH